MDQLRRRRTPKLGRHKHSGRACVMIDGRTIYLGKWGTPGVADPGPPPEEVEEQYHRLLAEWRAAGNRYPKPDRGDLVVIELIDRFLDHADSYYRKPSGIRTSSYTGFIDALGPLLKLYGRSKVIDFTPRALKTVRESMIDRDWSRGVCNKATNLIRFVFRWGVEEDLVEVDVLRRLEAIAPLKWGRTRARETPPVLPVPELHIDAVQPYVARQVWALIQLQRFSGSRGGELVKLRTVDLDTRPQPWHAELGDHKTRYKGRKRVLRFGPNAQEVLCEFMADRPIDAYLFSPIEAERERKARSAAGSRRPDQKPNPRKTARKIGEHYSSGSYRRAIQRGCDLAGIPRWSPHRLRHTAGTNVRAEYGLEGAQVVLGHARADVTEHYAERDARLADAIMLKIG